MTRTYEIVTPPEPAMSWETYAEVIQNEYTALLNRRDTSESDFQKFFEEHPCFLPEAYGTFERGAHGPYPGAVISQPKLPGIAQKIPDFLYIARDSGSVYVVLIEIERPNKSWATQAGHSSADFTQATNQIADWKQWFSVPSNITMFQDLYQIPQDWVRTRHFEQKYILIFGRRNDQSLTDEFKRKRSILQREDEFYMTFDRLQPQHKMKNCLCVKHDKDGYSAISVPATFELGPNMNVGFRGIRNKQAAVEGNRLISDVRKQFLISRIPYWDSWQGSGILNSRDRE